MKYSSMCVHWPARSEYLARHYNAADDNIVACSKCHAKVVTLSVDEAALEKG